MIGVQPGSSVVEVLCSERLQHSRGSLPPRRIDRTPWLLLIRQHLRHILQPNPRLVVPVKQAQRHFRPVEQAQLWAFGCGRVLSVTEGGDDFVGEPFPQGAVFGAVVVDEEGVDAGFADQQGVFDVAVDERFGGLVLVGIEFSELAVVEMDA